MKYIHYWRFAGRWYMIINNNPDHIRISSGDEYDWRKYHYQEENRILDSDSMTHRQIKEKLTTEYPDHVLVKEIAYNEGARWHGTKGGSREGNPIVNRAKYREKDPIKERNVARQIHACE